MILNIQHNNPYRWQRRRNNEYVEILQAEIIRQEIVQFNDVIIHNII